MFHYLAIRLLNAPIFLFLIISLSFFLIRLAPGGPFSTEQRLDPDIEQALLAKYRLDQPVWKQYLYFINDLLHGDFGPSLKHKNRTVNEIISTTLPHSLYLGALALMIAMSIGLPIGIISAMKYQTVFDWGLMTWAIIGISLPTFVIGPILQLIFSIHWKVLPLAGYDGFYSPQYLVLPAFTLAIPYTARIARLMRAGMLDVINQEFVITARAKGLSEFTILIRHILRGAILPVISFLGPATTQIITGSLVIEKIFQIPGLGREFIEGALSRDYTLVMGTVIVYGVIILVCNLLADVIYATLDPRVSY